MTENASAPMNWKMLLLIIVLSVAVGMFVMRPKPQPPVIPPALPDSTALVQLRKTADSAAKAAQVSQARADSAAKARQRLTVKVRKLEESLRLVTTVRDSNVVLVEIVGEQRVIIANQATEIVSLRDTGLAQMQRVAALQDEVVNYQARERHHTHNLYLHQRSIDSLTRVKTQKPAECRVLGIAKCPSRGTMFLAGIATTGILAVTINAVK